MSRRYPRPPFMAAAIVTIAMVATVMSATAQDDACVCPDTPGRAFLPAFVGLDFADAGVLADEVGYELAASEQSDAASEPGLIISQDPGPGSEAEPGDTIAVVVAVAPSEVDTASLSWAQLVKRAGTIKYKSLLRDPDRYEGKLLRFRGKVLQASDSDDGQVLLVGVTKGKYGLWSDNVFVLHDGGGRVIPDDIVEFVMTSTGTYGYESAGAGYLTVPSGYVEKLRLRS